MIRNARGGNKSPLESLDGVTEATASHTDKQAVVYMSSRIDEDVLKKAVEDKDYTVNSVEIS